VLIRPLGAQVFKAVFFVSSAEQHQSSLFSLAVSKNGLKNLLLVCVLWLVLTILSGYLLLPHFGIVGRRH